MIRSSDEAIENLKSVVENLQSERNFCVENMNKLFALKMSVEEGVSKVQAENIELMKKLTQFEERNKK